MSAREYIFLSYAACVYLYNEENSERKRMYCKALIFHMQSRGCGSVGKRKVGCSNPSRDRHLDKTGNDSFTAKRSALGVIATDPRR